MFASHQIVCLKCDDTHLYGEVIQVIEARQLCWVRPIVLVYGKDSSVKDMGCLTNWSETTDVSGIEPLIDGPDLLWPVNQFHLAMDTDVLPLLVSIQSAKVADPVSRQRAQHQLQKFIDHLWARTSRRE